MTVSVGRNEPCPCGSGRKYKRCCLRTQPPPEPLSYSDDVRKRAWDAVFAFGNRGEFAELRATARIQYCGEEFADLSITERDSAFKNESWAGNLWYWLLFEATLDRPGRAIVAEFLARKDYALRLSDRRYLEAMARSRLRLCEVEAVTRDVGLRVRDCWTDERFDLRERRFTHDAVPGMVAALRLRLDPDGTHVIDGPGFAGFTHVDKDAIVDDLRYENDPNMAAPIIAQHYLHEILLRPLPQLTTTSGDPMMFCRVLYDVLDETALRAGLESIKQIRRNEDGSLTWTRGKEKIVHATFRFDAGGLTVEAASQRRALAARELIERQARGSVRYRTIETEDPRQMLAQYLSRPASEREHDEYGGVKLPPEVEAKLIKDAQDKHYRKWLDMPLPVLGDFTPRQAAAMPGMRATLVGLLKDLAVMSERSRASGNFAYDSSWLWTELGLDPKE